jgi:hypothetical protein
MWGILERVGWKVYIIFYGLIKRTVIINTEQFASVVEKPTDMTGQ